MTEQVHTICLVEDDDVMGQSLVDRFDFEKIDCDWFKSLESARSGIASQHYAVVVSDLRLPDGNGEVLLDDLLAEDCQSPPIIFITGYGDLRHAVRLLRRGASDYVTKPFDMDRFLEKLLMVAPSLALKESHTELTPELGVSPAMREIQLLLHKIADYDVPVLLTGESGVGKEFAAHYFHRTTDHANSRPFIPVNCAAIPESLLESELFGHEAGAFTGSKGTHTGLFEKAHGGTLFLDEIGDMTLAMQVKILRAIQEKRIRRVGGNTSIPVDFRLICATNRDLKQIVAEGEFRQDLFYRISIFPVHIPPLRQRPEDIAWFADRFVAEFRRRSGNSNLRISDAAKLYLQTLDWPGNLRELNSRIVRICITSESSIIGVMQASSNLEMLPSQPDVRPESESLKCYLESCEREYILRALDREHWHIGNTADRLGISRKSLWERMRKLDIKSKSVNSMSETRPAGKGITSE